MFYKLIDIIDEFVWKAIVAYYSQSKVIVKLNQLISNCFSITEGCKQGGILSSFLFNFFINDMLTKCLNAKIGAKIGINNISIIAYCDDIILMSPTIKHLNILLDICYKYSVEWKLQYNQSKSVFMKFDERKDDLIQELPVMNGVSIDQQESMIYLGLLL